MSATSALESNEDLENIPLVRMADVQPDRTSDMYLGGIKKLDTCDVEDDYVCNDEENSNIGSMVSIQPEDVTTVEDDTQTVIPETLQQKQVPLVYYKLIYNLSIIYLYLKDTYLYLIIYAFLDYHCTKDTSQTIS